MLAESNVRGPETVLGSQIRKQALAVVCRNLATMLYSGVPVARALQVAGRKGGDSLCREVFTDIAEQVRAGEELSDGMARHGRRFPELVIDMVRLSEHSGALPEVLEHLAEHFDNIVALRRKFLSQITWPVIQFVAATGVVSLVIFVLGMLPGGEAVSEITFGLRGAGGAITFLAADRQHVEEAVAGDIIGLHNHGTINIGDSFSEGEQLSFTGIPDFAPELFRRAVLKDPLKLKALNKGLDQLCEEGATQLFRPLLNNDLVLGVVGPLQFDVAAFRLRDEYAVDCNFEVINVFTARWVYCADPGMLDDFKHKLRSDLAFDHTGELVFLARSAVSLNLTQERWPAVEFSATREHAVHQIA